MKPFGTVIFVGIFLLDHRTPVVPIMTETAEISRPDQAGAQPANKLTPMMRQYWDTKSQYPEALLFFRVGDFFEMFDSDAQVAARELDITLTSRPDSSYASGRVPLAGVPVRSYEMYVAKLLSKGYSVAVCDQVGIPGAEKGPVERQVKRVLTPGTIIESHLLPARDNNYLVAIVKGTAKEKLEDRLGLAFVDASFSSFLSLS